MTLMLLLLCDIFVLKSGGKLDGVERERKDGKVTIEVAAGMVTIDEKEIAEVKPAASKVAEYYERAEKLKDSRDTTALTELASWARSNGMGRFAFALYERILAIDSKNEAAHRGLGHERVGDGWMTKDEAVRARGYVEFEGKWVSPTERDLILASRALKRAEAAAAAEARRAVKREPRVVERDVVVVVERRVPEPWPIRYYDPYLGLWFYDYAWWHPKVAPGAVAAPALVVPVTPKFVSGWTGWPSPYKSVYEKK